MSPRPSHGILAMDRISHLSSVLCSPGAASKPLHTSTWAALFRAVLTTTNTPVLTHSGSRASPPSLLLTTTSTCVSPKRGRDPQREYSLEMSDRCHQRAPVLAQTLSYLLCPGKNFLGTRLVDTWAALNLGSFTVPFEMRLLFPPGTLFTGQHHGKQAPIPSNTLDELSSTTTASAMSFPTWNLRPSQRK